MGKSYELPRHGFARDMNFQVEKDSRQEMVFLLKSNAKTILSILNSGYVIRYPAMSSVRNTSSQIPENPCFYFPLEDIRHSVCR